MKKKKSKTTFIFKDGIFKTKNKKAIKFMDSIIKSKNNDSTNR